MHFVLISVLFSVSVSILLKLSRRFSIPAEQIIAWNYPAAIVLTWFFLEPNLYQLDITASHYRLFLSLGVLLPFIFWAIAASIRYTGIVRTEIAQRISLIIPLGAAFFFFGEQPETQSLIGISIGFLAVLGSLKWKTPNEPTPKAFGVWLYPVLIFLGMGIIDILFKQIAQHPSVPYTTSLFFVFTIAWLMSLLYVGLQWTTGAKINPKAVGWGLALGILNFGNILFYMKGHQAIPENPSIVFSAMNIGVIVVGALAGLFLFKERLSILHYFALVLAVVAIVIIGSA